MPNLFKFKLESEFQSFLIKYLKTIFPDAIILKNDPGYNQGIPDLLILLPNGKWAALECKRSVHEPHRPNQDYYVNKMHNMSFAKFIYPENMEEVLNELQRTFEFRR